MERTSGLVDAFAVQRGKAADVDIHVSYAGALTVDEQDDIARTCCPSCGSGSARSG